MKRIGFWAVVLAMCLSWVSTARAQTGFIPVFIDDFGAEDSSNIFQDSFGRIVIELSPQGHPDNFVVSINQPHNDGSALKVSTGTTAGNGILVSCATPGTSCDAIDAFGSLAGIFANGGTGIIGNGVGTGVEGRSDGGSAGLFRTNTGNILVGAGSGPGNRFRVDASGNVFASSYNTGGADFAESVEPAGRKDDYEAGDVLAIDQTAVRRVALARQPYSTLVAGIYSTKAGILASPYSMDDPRLTKEIPLAIVGIVPCKVSTENGPIKAGDLLVTSSTPGYAMKGTDRSRMLGAVVGKALEPVASGKCVIQVLVTLQ